MARPEWLCGQTMTSCPRHSHPPQLREILVVPKERNHVPYTVEGGSLMVVELAKAFSGCRCQPVNLEVFLLLCWLGCPFHTTKSAKLSKLKCHFSPSQQRCIYFPHWVVTSQEVGPLSFISTSSQLIVFSGSNTNCNASHVLRLQCPRKMNCKPQVYFYIS